MTINKRNKKQKETLKELGRLGALIVAFFFVVYLAIYLNFSYSPDVPWFIGVLMVGGYFIVIRARNVLSMFNDKKI
ncbi:MAG: hypothetical protein JKY27_10620 [Magnetovibrio sp.]|nr:hypothetical protein [Magnetovibrio sp.]